MLNVFGTHEATGVIIYVDRDNKIIKLQGKEKSEWFYYDKKGNIESHGYDCSRGIPPFMMFFGNPIFNTFDNFLICLKQKIDE